MLLFLEEIFVHATEGMPQSYPALFDEVMLEWGDFGMRGDLLFVFGICVVATAFLLYVLYRTKLGMATRAVAQQPVAAQLCGMSVQGTNSTTFIIAGVIGGIAGAMIGASVGILSPLLTVPVTVKGLIAAVIGGLGSIPGAIIGGLLIGAFENVFQLVRSVTERDMYVMLLPLRLSRIPSGRDLRHRREARVGVAYACQEGLEMRHVSDRAPAGAGSRRGAARSPAR